MKKILFLFALLPFLGAGCATNPPEKITLPVATTSVTTTNPDQGTITGALSYPSEGLPPDLKVCALNSVSNSLYCTMQPINNDSSYTLPVPSGAYTVYAQSGTLKGFYSEFITCGEDTKKCSSHKNIVVTVAAGSELTKIDPGDWYGPDSDSAVTQTVNCASGNCFQQKFAACQPAIFQADAGFAGVVYTIIGPATGGCKMTLKYTTNPNPAWVNKAMTCTFDNKLDFKKSVENSLLGAIKGSVVCSGPLYTILRSM